MIGRSAERAQLGAALDDVGVVQVVGPPGMGKSTLVRAVVDPDACWVSLEPVQPPQLEAAIGHALGVPPSAGAIEGALGDLSTVVLDGCEGVVEAVSAFVERVKRAVPEVKVVLTSRVRVPLALSAFRIELGTLSDEEGVALFLERAEAVTMGGVPDADREAVSELVRRFSGWPLALELAASRVRVYSVAEMLDEPAMAVLADSARRDRHRSLEDALAISWDLLPEDDRVALSRVSRFRSGFDRKAFQRVSGKGLEVLERLLDASFVRWRAIPGGRRYAMLTPVRDFVCARVGEAPADLEADERYAETVLLACEAAMAAERSSEAATSRATLRWWSSDLYGLLEMPGSARVRATLALAVLARSEGPTQETYERLRALRTQSLDAEWVLPVALAEADAAVRAFEGPGVLAALEGLTESSEVLYLQGLGEIRTAQLEQAMQTFSRAIELAVAESDRVAEVYARYGFGVAHMHHGLKRRARESFAHALGLVQQLDLPDQEGAILKFLAMADRDLGGPIAQRIAHTERAVTLHQKTGHLRMEAMARNQLATAKLDAQAPGADEELAHMLRLARRTGVQTSVQQAVLFRTILALDADRVQEASRILSSMGPPVAEFMSHWSRGLEGMIAVQLGARAEGVSLIRRAAEGLLALGLRADSELFAGALVVLGEAKPTEPMVDLPPEAPLALLADLCHAVADGQPIPTRVRAAAQQFLDLRLILRLTEGVGAEVDREGAWFATPAGRVSMGRKKVLRRVLAGLAGGAATGRPVTHKALLAIGWPGERMTHTSGRARLHVAISELRKAGLRDVLETVEVDGETAYQLRARVTG